MIGMSLERVVIVEVARTATGKMGGALSNIPAPVHGAECIKAIMEKTKLDPAEIDEVIMGTHFQAGTKANPSRQSAIYAGLPDTIPAFTPNKNCATAMKAMQLAAQSIQVGDNQVVIAGGSETMSAIPYLLPKARFGYRMGQGTVEDSMLHDGLVDPFMNYHMGITAENVAEMCGITREMQDRFAVLSHNNAQRAWAEGKYDADIVPITIKSKKGDFVFDHDETYQKDARYENFEKLKPVFKKDGGTVTVGNASPINDGSAAVLMMSEKKAEKLGLRPLARYVAAASSAVHPSIMGYAPVSAVEKLEAKTGIKRNQVGLYELNEAFAAQAAACVQDLKIDPSIVNVNGGAIALGHAVGCTGCRISITLIREMIRRDVQYGVASLCIGGGQGMAMMFELCK